MRGKIKMVIFAVVVVLIAGTFAPENVQQEKSLWKNVPESL